MPNTLVPPAGLGIIAHIVANSAVGQVCWYSMSFSICVRSSSPANGMRWRSVGPKLSTPVAVFGA
eukprot:5035869-Pyramimonas_sp.AAC.2